MLFGVLVTQLCLTLYTCSDSSATPSFPSQPEGKIGKRGKWKRMDSQTGALPQSICTLRRASNQGTSIDGGAETCQVGGRLCECPGEKRQRVCALNQPGSLN